MENKEESSERASHAVWIKKPDGKTDRLLGNTYRKDQLIVFFKKAPSEADIRQVKLAFRKCGFKTEGIRIKSCGNCPVPVQLWSAKGIHSLISTDSIKAGSGPKTTTVGESYSLNYYNTVPDGPKDRLDFKLRHTDPCPQKKAEVVVAVLDTGIDTALVNPAYLWQEADGVSSKECYKAVRTGWNFVDDNGDYRDDHPSRHGTIVSQYIINEFKSSQNNNVKIMPLKTHDKSGQGDLFGVICALHFAIAKGAQLINASWGFYYYYELPIPYLKTLITGVLRKEGILFVTAAGNKIDADDVLAKQLYMAQYGIMLTDVQLRNLAIHNFYPANLSGKAAGVIAVTTTDGRMVSPTQNYSNLYVDLGVIADEVSREGMKFKLPFESSGGEVLISGSSFATAIATGIIGASCEKKLYAPNLNKADFLAALQVLKKGDGSGMILEEVPVLARRDIKSGACVK